jgi:hypothetical protein
MLVTLRTFRAGKRMWKIASGSNTCNSVGLLRGSFRPDDEICAIRSLWRHRDNLIQLATVHLQHMQKALDQMNFMSSVISQEPQVWRS